MNGSKKSYNQRLPHQKKKARKGLKSMRGTPEYYSELKNRISVCVTATACQGLDEISHQLEISRSELIERIGRGKIKLVFPEDSAIE
jgi:hypothetical protein